MPDGDVFDFFVAPGFRKPARTYVGGRFDDPSTADEVVNAIISWIQANRCSELPDIVRIAQNVPSRGADAHRAMEVAFEHLDAICIASGSEAAQRLVAAAKEEILCRSRFGGQPFLDTLPWPDYELASSILVKVADGLMFSSAAMHRELLRKHYVSSYGDFAVLRQAARESLLAAPSLRKLAVHMIENRNWGSIRRVRTRRPKKLSQVDILAVSLID